MRTQSTLILAIVVSSWLKNFNDFQFHAAVQLKATRFIWAFIVSPCGRKGDKNPTIMMMMVKIFVPLTSRRLHSFVWCQKAIKRGHLTLLFYPCGFSTCADEKRKFICFKPLTTVNFYLIRLILKSGMSGTAIWSQINLRVVIVGLKLLFDRKLHEA